MSFSVPLRSVAQLQRAVLLSRVAVPRAALAVRTSTTLNDGANKAPDFSHHFKYERLWSAALLPVMPAAYFVHGPVMDAVLTIALSLHIHWGSKL
ncbi:unnamed protein product, partial [Mesorhabditis spiculigera]